MSTKFFDILPPGKISEKPQIEKPKKRIREKKLFPGKGVLLSLAKVLKAKSFSKKIAFSLIPLLIIFGAFLFFTLKRAEIEIMPETELIDFEKTVLLDSQFNEVFSVWLTESKMPAEIIETERSAEREFPATGEALVEKKAEGTIRVYNDYSTHSQTFVAKTRFVSADGKLYRSLEKITIPGQKYEEGKLKPGFVDIKVRAAEAGEDYNIGPTTFSIPGLFGTEMYTAFYGKSFSAMEGGFKGKALQVKKEDIDGAKELLKREIFEETEALLQKKCDENSFTLVKNCLSKEVLEESCGAEVGEAINSFICKVKVGIKALVFKEKDLKDLTETWLLFKVEKGKEIKPKSLKLSYFFEEKDLEKGQATLNLTALANIYSPLDEDFLKKGIAGKSAKAAAILLESQPGIKGVKVKLWPFWVKEVPENLERIKIKTLLDPSPF